MMGHNILVVAAHPDDEILGCGGTVRRHILDGDVARTLILAEGITSRDNSRDTDLRGGDLNSLHSQSARAAGIIGVERIRQCGFPDNRMDCIDLLDVVKEIEREISEFQPDTIYTHHGGDVNVDHQITHRAVVTACRPLPGCSVRTLLFFETPSSTEWQIPTAEKAFMANWYMDIGATLEKKLEALQCYDSEMRECPHPRSYEGIRALAAYRGLTVGCAYAEAFMLGRLIG